MILGAPPDVVRQCRKEHLPAPRHFAIGVTEALVSYLVGIAFGRFDPRASVPKAEERADPFLQLPRSAPACRIGKGDQYDILVDDPGHVHDIFQRCALSFRDLGFDESEWGELWREIGAEEDTGRTWLAKHFFQIHLSRYTAFRRKAPLYLQIGVASGRYSVWVYLHAATADTLYRVQNEYVAPKLALEVRRLEEMKREFGTVAKAADRRRLSMQEALVDELRVLLGDVERVAPLWNPNLEDGTVIALSPLWRLLPQHKGWQRELKANWELLCAAEYDWTHLAMRLWPERVVQKCAIDRSLAIAHGLEDIFWSEGADGRWKPRPTPTRPVEQLVGERTSIAVKSALKSLIEVSVVNANGVRGRGRRASNTASDMGAG
jgi:hypothetical protein